MTCKNSSTIQELTPFPSLFKALNKKDVLALNRVRTGEEIYFYTHKKLLPGIKCNFKDLSSFPANKHRDHIQSPLRQLNQLFKILVTNHLLMEKWA